MNIERLTKLAELLDTVPPDRFNMDYWGLAPHGDLEDLNIAECGTAACALGWACSIPEFRAAGLRLRKIGTSIRYDHFSPEIKIRSEAYPALEVAHEAFHAGAKFFDITLEQSEWLFLPREYEPPGYDQDEDPPIIITPADVAARIRALIERG